MTDEKEIIKEDKIVFWIHRILEQETQTMKGLIEEISVLNHQAQHFNKMHPSQKNLVIQELNGYFIEFGWKKEIKDFEY